MTRKNSAKSKNLVKPIELSSRSGFFILRARLTFIKLRQAFTKAPILHYFNLEYYNWVEADASGYAIGGVLSQLTLDNSSRWHQMAFFFQKMILTET